MSKPKLVVPKVTKNRFLHWLILKQTIKNTWKSKLQLTILLLLAAFGTTVITGSWISYSRLNDEANYMGLNQSNFNGVMQYNDVVRPINQIAEQAFSLSLGHIYVEASSANPTTASDGLYFDDTRIGKEIRTLTPDDVKIEYTLNGTTVNGIKSFGWTNPSHPIEYNLGLPEVKASIYGQLNQKISTANRPDLKKRYQAALDDLYTRFVTNNIANKIANSLQMFIGQWISAHPSSQHLKDPTELTKFLLEKKINYHQGTIDPALDFSIPSEANVDDQSIFTKIVKKNDPNPRASGDDSSYGLNGQWMRIYRNDSLDINNPTSREDLSNYVSPEDNFGIVTDNYGDQRNIPSYTLISAAAALQNTSIQVINQFSSTAGADPNTAKSINVKIVSLGYQDYYSKVNLKIFSGTNPLGQSQIVISPQYARIHNIKPGDNIIINTKPFTVAGIGGDAFNLYPTINPLDAIPNTRNDYIAYVFPNTYNDTKWIDHQFRSNNSLIYFLPWNQKNPAVFNTGYFDDFFQRNIFSNNGKIEGNQKDYNQMLINKYGNGKLGDSKYVVQNNGVINSENSQFQIYYGGRTLFFQILKMFSYVLIGAVLFLTLITVFITFLIVKKAIQAGQVSMGILKASGYKTGQIASAYTAYPILVLLVAIPIGWICGLLAQVYFTEIFNSLFILPYTFFSFSILPMLVSILVIVGFILITSIATAYFKLQKPPLLLIKKDSDIALGNTHIGWFQRKFVNNFKMKFWISLTKTSWKKIAVTSSVIGLATLSIMATVSIPGSINQIRLDYFKSQKYQNYYQYQSPAPNNPLSKYGLTNWTNLSNPNHEAFYPTAGNMPFPTSIIIKDKNSNVPLAWFNPLDYKKDSSGKGNFDKTMVHAYPDCSQQQFQTIINQVGQIYDNADNGPMTLDLLTWNYLWLGGRSFSNQMVVDLQKADNSKNKMFSKGLISFATTFLPSLLGVPNPGIPPSTEAISQILRETLPGFIRQILDQAAHDSKQKGFNPYDEFTIGHNSVAINPNYDKSIDGPQEELVTSMQLVSNDSSALSKENLNVLGVNPMTKMFSMSNQMANNLKYQPDAKIIPMVINRAFAARYGLGVGSQFNAFPDVKSLYYLNDQGQYKPIKKAAWYYGDNPEQPSGDASIWDKTGNKWNSRSSQPINNLNFSNDFGYRYDGMYDKNGNQIISDYPKPWNDTNKVWLKLPDDIDAGAKSGQIDNHGHETFKIGNISTTDGKWIRPYDLQVTDAAKAKDLPSPTTILQKPLPEWYGGMIDKGILSYRNSISSGTKTDIEKNYQTWRSAVSDSNPVPTTYRIIGIQDSYDSPKALVDQAWANQIVGYSTYDGTKVNNATYQNGLYQWFNGKLSAADNIYDIVARTSFKYKSDDYSIYGAKIQGNNQTTSLINSSDLLSRKVAMLNKMTGIAFSASALFIAITIICSILIVIMITDSFTEQFRRFMAHMKSEGYTTWEINYFTLGIFTPWALLGYIAGYLLGYLLIFGLLKAITTATALVFPFSFIWWIVPLTFFLIGGIYASTFIINTARLQKMNLIEVLKSED